MSESSEAKFSTYEGQLSRFGRRWYRSRLPHIEHKLKAGSYDHGRFTIEKSRERSYIKIWQDDELENTMSQLEVTISHDEISLALQSIAITKTEYDEQGRPYPYEPQHARLTPGDFSGEPHLLSEASKAMRAAQHAQRSLAPDSRTELY